MSIFNDLYSAVPRFQTSGLTIDAPEYSNTQAPGDCTNTNLAGCYRYYENVGHWDGMDSYRNFMNNNHDRCKACLDCDNAFCIWGNCSINSFSPNGTGEYLCLGSKGKNSDGTNNFWYDGRIYANDIANKSNVKFWSVANKIKDPNDLTYLVGTDISNQVMNDYKNNITDATSGTSYSRIMAQWIGVNLGSQAENGKTTYDAAKTSMLNRNANVLVGYYESTRRIAFYKNNEGYTKMLEIYFNMPDQYIYPYIIRTQTIPTLELCLNYLKNHTELLPYLQWSKKLYGAEGAKTNPSSTLSCVSKSPTEISTNSLYYKFGTGEIDNPSDKGVIDKLALLSSIYSALYMYVKNLTIPLNDALLYQNGSQDVKDILDVMSCALATDTNLLINKNNCINVLKRSSFQDIKYPSVKKVEQKINGIVRSIYIPSGNLLTGTEVILNKILPDPYTSLLNNQDFIDLCVKPSSTSATGQPSGVKTVIDRCDEALFYNCKTANTWTNENNGKICYQWLARSNTRDNLDYITRFSEGGDDTIFNSFMNADDELPFKTKKGVSLLCSPNIIFQYDNKSYSLEPDNTDFCENLQKEFCSRPLVWEKNHEIVCKNFIEKSEDYGIQVADLACSDKLKTSLTKGILPTTRIDYNKDCSSICSPPTLKFKFWCLDLKYNFCKLNRASFPEDCGRYPNTLEELTSIVTEFYNTTMSDKIKDICETDKTVDEEGKITYPSYSDVMVKLINTNVTDKYLEQVIDPDSFKRLDSPELYSSLNTILINFFTIDAKKVYEEITGETVTSLNIVLDEPEEPRGEFNKIWESNNKSKETINLYKDVSLSMGSIIGTVLGMLVIAI